MPHEFRGYPGGGYGPHPVCVPAPRWGPQWNHKNWRRGYLSWARKAPDGPDVPWPQTAFQNALVTNAFQLTAPTTVFAQYDAL